MIRFRNIKFTIYRPFLGKTLEIFIFHHSNRMGIITLHRTMEPYTLKKSLGQHFLHDENIARKIVEALSPEPGSCLLEIGPGGGALTKWLLEFPDVHFKALEIDQEKINWLRGQYLQLGSNLIHGNILSVAPPFDGKFNIIGNFPYNISSQIVFRILEWKEQVRKMVGMFQKEVARRITSAPGSKEYGILSVLTQAFYQVDYLFEVSETCFTPPPKVKSAVIRMEYKGNIFNIADEKRFFTLVKAAFNQRRKMLRNPLKSYFPAAFLQEAIFNKRAEELNVREFVDLSNHVI